jgi:hypothetical protein
MKKVTVRFTNGQYARLQEAAKVLGHNVTIEDIVASGAMYGIDMSGSERQEAIDATLWSIREYVDRRRTYSETERETKGKGRGLAAA